MGMFTGIGSVNESIEQMFSDPNRVMELFIVDEVSQLPDELVQEFCKEGGVGQQLVAEGKLRKKTLVRLSKKDDLARRETMIAMQLAKEHNDPLWKKFMINTKKRNELKAAMLKKYGTKATRGAKQAQQMFLKGGAKKTGILPKDFQRSVKNDENRK